MAHKVIDRCKETTSTTGTGTLTLTGAVANFVAMADATQGLTADGDTSWFCAENGAEWEVFLGTRVDATHLARTTVISSSNAGAAVSFTAAPTVFGTVPASKLSTVGPAFSAYLSADQSITSATFTKAALNTEEFDTGGCFDSTTNYRFTPNVAGYYRMSWSVRVTLTSGNLTIACGSLYKNGAEFKRVQRTMTTGAATLIEETLTGSCIVYMNGTTDYLELYGYGQATGPKIAGTAPYTNFSGEFVRGA